MHNQTTQEFSYEALNLVLSTVTSSLSLFGSTIVFCTYALWPDLRTNSRKIITFICVGDFLTALTNLFGLWDKAINNTTVLCEIEALVNIVAVLPSFFWTVYLSLYLYLAICTKISYQSERRVMRAFHVTAWGIPLVLAMLAAGFRAVGNSYDYASAGWCWVRESESWREMVLWMVVFGKGWEILAYFAITSFYVLIKMHIGREMKSGCEHGSSFLTVKALDVAKKADTKFTFIPLVFILLRMWGTIRFLRFVTCLPECHHTGASFQGWLFVLQGIGDSGQGFANFVLFCVCTDKIRQRFKLICFKNGSRKPSDAFESDSLCDCKSANSCYGTTSSAI